MYAFRAVRAKRRVSLTFPDRLHIIRKRHGMRQVTVRLDLRVPEEMKEFLLNEASSRKLSFEGLILMYIEDQMKKSRQESRHRSPREQ